MWRLRLGRAQFAVCVDTAGQQVVQQALFDDLKLGDDRLGVADRGIEESRTWLALSDDRSEGTKSAKTMSR